MRVSKTCFLVFAMAATIQLFLAACSSDTNGEPPGDTTIEPPEDLAFVFFDSDPTLSDDEQVTFNIGRGIFHAEWTAPDSTGSETDVLGPYFNANSCASCHAATGVRSFPEQGAFDGKGLLVRISVPGFDPTTGAPLPHPTYGGQLQDRAVGDIEAEGTTWTDYVVQTGNYTDGSTFEILWPTLTIRNRNYGDLEPDVQLSARVGSQLVGMGLLEAIPDETILSFADPADADGDGISGVANVVWNPISNEPALGRFGWKSNIASLEHQIAAAFGGDIGVTTPLIPEPNCSPVQLVCPNTTEPEVDEVVLDRMLLYVRGLAVPPPRDTDSTDVKAGAELFDTFGCASCHIETLGTGDSPIPALSDREIHPYTDLLLHDMGFDMGDGRPDFLANGNEWRTAPLWGLGLIPSIDGALGLLHDGRARTIDEAILWHGGEGRFARAAYLGADEADRERLLTFLRSL